MVLAVALIHEMALISVALKHCAFEVAEADGCILFFGKPNL